MQRARFPFPIDTARSHVQRKEVELLQAKAALAHAHWRSSEVSLESARRRNNQLSDQKTAEEDPADAVADQGIFGYLTAVVVAPITQLTQGLKSALDSLKEAQDDLADTWNNVFAINV